MHMSQELIFTLGLFATVAILSFALSGLVFKKEASDVIKRLRGQSGEDSLDGPRRPGDVLGPAVQRFSEKAGAAFLPKDPRNENYLRRQLAYAGFYSTNAMQTVVGAKVILLLVLGGVGWLGGSLVTPLVGLIFLMVGSCLGYLIPSLYLKLRIGKRQVEFESALPDALDLLVVCVEAGLTLDAAMQRVGQEIAMAHPEISREFGITHMETRIGVQRMQALRNLGQRTGSTALQSLAAMLVQTERFGTSIAQALRVHAESLRVKRQHKAEEQAAKTTVKLAFPVVLFIFPCLLVVLGGPAIILFLKSPFFTGMGQ
jgi:tight adherence protein C